MKKIKTPTQNQNTKKKSLILKETLNVFGNFSNLRSNWESSRQIAKPPEAIINSTCQI